MSVASVDVAVAVGVVNVEALEEDPHPGTETIEKIKNARQQGRTKRVVNCISYPRSEAQYRMARLEQL